MLGASRMRDGTAAPRLRVVAGGVRLFPCSAECDSAGAPADRRAAARARKLDLRTPDWRNFNF